MRLTLVPIVLPAALALAASPAAAAPALSPLKPCYVVDDVAQEHVALGGTGFSPNALVDVHRDGVIVVEGVQADAQGQLPFGTITAPAIDRGRREFTVSAIERGNSANNATARSEVARLDVTISPKVARPRSRIRMRGIGFTAAKSIYAHYVRGRTARRSVRLGAPEGPCGTFDVRRRQFPFTPRPGRWTIQIDQQRRYSASPSSAAVLIDVEVKRVPRSH